MKAFIFSLLNCEKRELFSYQESWIYALNICAFLYFVFLCFMFTIF